ncbi:MAG: hypothetical protein RI883_1170 [Bacteroidota bacterium]|jgi:hypothetical protein
MYTQYYITLGIPKYDDDAIVCFSNSWDKYNYFFNKVAKSFAK